MSSPAPRHCAFLGSSPRSPLPHLGRLWIPTSLGNGAPCCPLRLQPLARWPLGLSLPPCEPLGLLASPWMLLLLRRRPTKLLRRSLDCIPLGLPPPPGLF